ncbi:MAG: DNA glycosylase AlkZ-like family protein, partial [Micromonosporaceae bacterium]
MTTELKWARVCGRRLRRHGLASPLAEGGPASAAAAMCGTHAQVLSAAEVSIGLRLAGATRTDVQHALWSEHTLIKTFGPRGTIHLLPANELALWCGALGSVPP